MIRLLKFLITGSWHEHKWEIYRTSNVTEYPDGDKNRMPVGYVTTYIQKCAVCGKLKVTKVER